MAAHAANRGTPERNRYENDCASHSPPCAAGHATPGAAGCRITARWQPDRYTGGRVTVADVEWGLCRSKAGNAAIPRGRVSAVYWVSITQVAAQIGEITWQSKVKWTLLVPVWPRYLRLRRVSCRW